MVASVILGFMLYAFVRPRSLTLPYNMCVCVDLIHFVPVTFYCNSLVR